MLPTPETGLENVNLSYNDAEAPTAYVVSLSSSKVSRVYIEVRVGTFGVVKYHLENPTELAVSCTNSASQHRLLLAERLTSNRAISDLTCDCATTRSKQWETLS
jgi:hypothetical protein